MPDNEMTRLRQIMYEPTSCWLSTEYSGDRWLTDQYVLLCVSDVEAFRELPDGPYKLTVSNGPQPRPSIPEPDIEAYFGLVAGASWFPADPSEWSVAEHPGKAMLWVSDGKPCLMGEPTWVAIKRHYSGVLVEYAVERNLFRFSDSTAEVKGHLRVVDAGAPFAYAAGIRVPDGQEAAAFALASALDSTSKGEPWTA